MSVLQTCKYQLKSLQYIFIVESQQNLNIDKDVTLPASARKVKTLGLKVRNSNIPAGLVLKS